MSFLEKSEMKASKMVTSPAALADGLRGKNGPAMMINTPIFLLFPRQLHSTVTQPCWTSSD